MIITYDELATIADSVEGRVYADYSGRGMYGRTCAAIVINDESDLVALNHAIAREASNADLRAEMLLRVSTDNLGYNLIAYWKGVTCEDSPEEEED